MNTRHKAALSILALLLSGSIAARAQVAQATPPVHYEVPSASLKTAKSGAHIDTVNTTYTRETQTNHLLGVAGDIRFFHPPADGFLVQVFFMAKSESGGDHFIYYIIQDKKEGGVVHIDYSAPPLEGTNQYWLAVPYTGTVTGKVNDDYGNSVKVKGEYTAVATASNTRLGSKFEGWIVRIVATDGHVLRVESNQPSLSDLATKRGEIFDDAIAGLSKKKK